MNITAFFPAFALFWIEKMRLMPKNVYMKGGLEFSLLAFELYLCVPVGIALYPRYGKIEATELEPEFQNIRNRKGELVKDFVFNKGL